MKINFKLSKQSIITFLLFLTIIAGFYMRIMYVYKEPPKFSADAVSYDAMTKQFIEKGILGYKSDKPNANVTPGYPLFLAAVYSTAGYQKHEPFTAVRLVQAVLGTASIFLIYLIGTHVANRKVGLIAAVIYAVYPTFLYSISLLLTEVLYTFLFLLYFWLQLKALQSMNRWLSIAAGAAFALAVLTRPAIFPLFIVPFVYQWIVTREKKVISSFIYTTAAVVVCMLPWWIRNFVDFGKVILLSTGSANPLYVGAFPHMQGWKYVPREQQFSKGIEVIINGFLTQPIVYLKWFTLGKLNIIFGKPWFDHYLFKTFLPVHQIIMVLGWLGVILAVLEKRIRFIALYIILMTGIQLMFIPERRYAYSIIPLLIVLSAYILDYLFFSSQKKAEV